MQRMVKKIILAVGSSEFHDYGTLCIQSLKCPLKKKDQKLYVIWEISGDARFNVFRQNDTVVRVWDEY